MKIAAFTLTFWHSKEQADALKAELEVWEQNIRQTCNPSVLYMVSGTHSNPEWNPVSVPIINCDVPFDRPASMDWSYSGCATTAGIWNFILNTDCDLLVYLCSDGLVGLNLQDTIKEFMDRPELICSPNWGPMMENAFYMMKRPGAVWFSHSRLERSLESGKKEMIEEFEFAKIFEGKWWNPFKIDTGEQHYRYSGWIDKPSEETIVREWPILIRPTASLAEKFINNIPNKPNMKLLKQVRELAGVQRDNTFEEAAKFILGIKQPMMIETGCYRGSDCDGQSTVILSLLAQKTGGTFISHDLNQPNIDKASERIARDGLQEHCRFVCGDSLVTLQDCPDNIAFVYLDSYDFEEHKAIDAQTHQLKEAEILLPKMAQKSAFLLDDCDLPHGGKAGLSIKPITDAGYKQVASEYQKLFIRS